MIVTNKDHYDYFLKKYPENDAKTVGWGSDEKQRKCFDILTYYTDKMDYVLDVGCGIGSLKDYNGWFDYHGIDVHEEMIKIAQQRHPRSSFQCIDLMDYDTKHDWVIACGVFNLRSQINQAGDAYQYHWLGSKIKKMFSLCNIGMAFNLLRFDNKKPAIPELFYYEPFYLYEYLTQYPRRS